MQKPGLAGARVPLQANAGASGLPQALRPEEAS